MHTFPTPTLPKLESFPFTDFVEFVVTTSPRFASLSGIVRAGRLINGTRHEDGLVRWADDDAKIMQEICGEEDEAKALQPPTKLNVTVTDPEGKVQTQEINVPGVWFAPFVAAILASKPDEARAEAAE